MSTDDPLNTEIKDKRKHIIQVLMKQAQNRGLQEGDVWYCLPSAWWRSWNDYTSPNSSTIPCRIENRQLLREFTSRDDTVSNIVGGPLILGLEQDQDVVLVPQEVWNTFKLWFGADLSVGRFVRRVKDSRSGEYALKIQLYMNSEEARALAKPSAKPQRMSKLRCVVCDRIDSRFCTRCRCVAYCGKRCQTSHWKYHREACADYKSKRENNALDPGSLNEYGVAFVLNGIVGLCNLGNTCFMNSALQCLSHTKTISRHFLSDKFKEDLNYSNPLGSGGGLALAYGELLKNLWFSNRNYISPTQMKRAISRFASQFLGFEQHDAQELMAYLLDGLHEDLNRVVDKPYVEAKEANGRPDEVVAAEAWSNHLKRNRSIFVENIQGQFKSTVVCPNCSKVAIMFDPFNCIQLEIPARIRKKRKLVVTFVRSASSKAGPHSGVKRQKNGIPVEFYISVDKNSRCRAIKDSMADLSGAAAADLIVCDVYSGYVYKYFRDDQYVSSISDEDNIVAYEAPRSASDTHYVIIRHQMGADSFVGLPILLSLQENLLILDFLKLVYRQIRHCFVSSKPALSIGDAAKLLGRHMYFTNNRGELLYEDPVSYVLEQRPDAKLSQLFGDSTTMEYFKLDHSMDLQKHIDRSQLDAFDRHVSSSTAAKVSQGVTLYDCFKEFTTPELLDEDNLWRCSHCKKHCQATKTMEVWKFPDVLIISLKRFEYRNHLSGDKLTTKVDFPLENLDLSPYCLQDTVKNGNPSDLIYDLYAVSNHFGRMGAGHYTAYAREWDERDWYAFDDTHVSKMEEQKVVSNAAYILFYKRRNLK